MHCNKEIKGKKDFTDHILEFHEQSFLWMFDNNLGGKHVRKELDNIKQSHIKD